MRCSLLRIGALNLGLAALIWTAAPISAQRGGHVGGGHVAAARVGSVHYAARPASAGFAPARVAPVIVAPYRVPVARTGTIRSEHYAGAGYGGIYGNPYRSEYFSRFRPGYLPFVLSDGYQYYGYYDLPLGYQQVVSDGNTYFFFDGVYYQAYIIGDRTVYVAVPT
jgi:hypothetical protein